MNQLYVYIYPLFFGFPSHLGHHRAGVELPVLYSGLSLVQNSSWHISGRSRKIWDVISTTHKMLHQSSKEYHCWVYKGQEYAVSSVQFSRSVVSNSLQPHESHHTRPPCPSPTPGVHPDSYPSSQWCYPAISSSIIPFSSCLQSLPASESTWKDSASQWDQNLQWLSRKNKSGDFGMVWRFQLESQVLPLKILTWQIPPGCAIGEDFPHETVPGSQSQTQLNY